MRARALVVAMLAVAGCGGSNACKHGTVLLQFALAGSAAHADQLQIQVAIDGGAPKVSTVTPSGAVGTIEIDFPAGYPSGRSLSVVVTALASGTILGSNGNAVLLGSNCGNLSITISGGTIADLALGPDLATGVVDLGGPVVDIAGADLTPIPDLMPECVGVATRCNGNQVQSCSNGVWTNGATCAAFCQGGACVTPASCNGLASGCGSTGNTSCCLASLVPGGSFARSYDGNTYTDSSYKAMLSPFILDDYEVTVGRFRQFWNAYPGSKPVAGSGKNPNDASDPGWDATWDASLPASQAALTTELGCTGATWTASAGVNEDKPVNCVDWYTAYAFCIWDGARLPTEAEWDFAAQCGSMQRVYPWSTPASSTTIDGTYAVYMGAAITDVGLTPKGTGCYGQLDLAGNLEEWVQDWYASPYPTTTCNDCANLSASTLRSQRGGEFNNGNIYLYGAARSNAPPTYSNQVQGFRCARQP